MPRQIRQVCRDCGALQFMVVDGSVQIKCQRCGKIVSFPISDLARDGWTTLMACERELTEGEQDLAAKVGGMAI